MDITQMPINNKISTEVVVYLCNAYYEARKMNRQ